MVDGWSATVSNGDPKVALATFFVVVAIALLLFWPRRGVVPRLRRKRKASDRVRVEDALKHLYHATIDGRAADTDRLAGALEIPRDRALEILSRLQADGLAVSAGSGALLTERGHRYALRVVRSHRLLESYLADRTGVRPEEWHVLADEREHDLTHEEVEDLASRIGHPRYDPHGDPIPTEEGELPDARGIPLSLLAPEEAGTIVHLEDEPVQAYERLRAMGLALGKSLIVRAATPSYLEVELDGRTVPLPRVLAPAVTVVPHAPQPSTVPRTLADLAPGESGRVASVASTCRGAQRRRLLDLGIVPGTEIGVAFASASGDPVAFRVRGALIALRLSQAAWIELEPASGDSGRVA